MGDTGIFGDMALIDEIHQPEIGIVPIGDRYTMGGDTGGDGLPALLQVPHDHPLPLRHLSDRSTRPPDKFIREMGAGRGSKVLVPEVGEAFEV